MDLSEVPTSDLIAAVAERMDTCLFLGIRKDKLNQTTFYRRTLGTNTWSLYGPLLAEIRFLDKQFDTAQDESQSPDNVIDF